MVAAGRLTPGELRSPAWRRLFRDVYACADLPITHELRAAAAARLVVPGAVVTGRSAGVLWGPATAGRDDDVELTVPPGSNVCRLPGIRVRRRSLDPHDSTARRGTWCARRPRVPRAVAAVRPARQPRSPTGWPARRRRRSSDSCCTARPAASLQGPTASLRGVGGREVLPFGWAELKVAVEYDGVWHNESPQQVGDDRRRLNRLTEAGWTVVFVTAADLYHPERVLARIALALSRASVGPASSRQG